MGHVDAPRGLLVDSGGSAALSGFQIPEQAEESVILCLDGHCR